MNVKELFSDQVFNRKLLRLAFPITLQNLMLALVAAADAIMLGRVSQNAMAAVSLATQIQFVQNMLLGAIVSGVGILGAQYWGKRDSGKMGEIFSLSIHEAVLVSAAFFLGCRFIPEKLMLLFAHDPELVEIGAEYLRVASWSYLLTGISQCYLAIMRVSEHASRSAWISSGAVILNIVLNAVFIFGWFGVPAMGVRGAALATVIARIIELAWCIVSSYEKSFVPLRIRELLRFNAMLFRDFWHYTLPVLGSFLLWGIGFTSYTAIMGHLGPDAAAANAVAAVVRDLMCCLCNGIAAGAGILIGNELGAGNLSLGKTYGQKAMVLAFLTADSRRWCFKFDSAGFRLSRTDGTGASLSGRHVRDSLGLHDRALCLHGGDQRDLLLRRGYAVRCVQSGGLHVGNRAALCVSRRILLSSSGACGLRLHLSGRGGQDSVGDAALPQIQVGQEYHPELNGELQQGGKSRIHSRFSCSIGKQLQFHVVQCFFHLELIPE